MNVFEGYRLTSPFGYRIHPVYKTRKFHKGVDLVTPKANDPIYAFTAGEVFHAKEGATGSGFGNYGIVVAIKDDKGYLHCYAHLSAALVKVGERVSKGQMIGRQGNTGISTGPHLHYEIRKKVAPSFGYTVDQSGVVEPTQYLINYYGQQTKQTIIKEEDKPMTAEEKKKMDELEQKVQQQAKTIEQQSAWIGSQKKLTKMPCPTWAKDAYNYYKDYIRDETGSYDFWRQLEISYRKEKGLKIKK